MSFIRILSGAIALGFVLAGCAAVEPPKAASPYDKPGFVTKVDDGRLWVFRAGSADLEAFQTKGKPARQVTRIAAGPNGMTLKSTETETIDAYIVSKPGFETAVKDGRLWVFKSGSKEHQDFVAKGAPARQVTRIAAGPGGMTVKSSDAEVIDAYLAAN